ncbi:MAG: hypothetical protein AAGB05_17820 [Pseudomonadota bacterium]
MTGGSSGPPPASYRAFNTMDVLTHPTRPDTMLVLSRALAGPKDYFCAAGDYADRYLDTPVVDRIYVLETGPSPDRRARTAVTFTTAPPEELVDGPRPGDDGNYSLRLTEPGFNIQAGQARSFCVESRRRLAGVRLF